MAPVVTVVELDGEHVVYLDGYLVLSKADIRSLVGMLWAIDPKPVVQVFKAHPLDVRCANLNKGAPVCLKELNNTLKKYEVEGFGDFVV